ncbi:MAG: SagB/ThcOx family dehydrogenase [Nitrososphaeraceae archaeon]
MNKEVKYALEYHQETKHSEVSIRSSNLYLDWDNKPQPFKFYTSIQSIHLPVDFPIPTLNVITMKDTDHVSCPDNIIINSKLLSSLLFFSSGITREIKFPHGRYFMRAAPATGALYPIELYIVSENISGLQAGVYHFCPGQFTLTKLRSGDYRLLLSEAAGYDQVIRDSPFTIILTSIAWRNAWKYQARSYRHWFWDSGVITANLLATATSFGLDTKFILGFVDKAVNEILCLDEEKEASIVLAPVGIGLSLREPQQAENPAKFVPDIVPISKSKEIEYPQIWRLHKVSSFNSNGEVRKWTRSIAMVQDIKEAENNDVVLQSKLIDPESVISQPLSNIILLRGSTRKFSRRPITFVQLSNILYSLTRTFHSDFVDKMSMIDIYFIANDVTNIQKGAYFFNRKNNSIDLLKVNVHRNMSGYLCLEQSLFSDASVVFYMMTNLKLIVDTLGNRGYRLCQFESGIIAGRIYLSAYSQGIGASGSTFYDDAVTEFFSPHAKDKDAMIAVGIGIPGYKSKPGKILAGKFSRSDLLS